MANIADLQVSLNLDTSKFKTDVAAATNDVKELKAALTGLKSRTFKIDLSTNIKSQIAGFKSAKTEIKNLQNHLSGLQSSIKATTGNKTLNLTVNSNAEKVYNDMKNINVNSKLLNATLRGSSGALTSYNNSLKGIHNSIKGVSASIKSLTSDVKRLNTVLSQSNTQLKQMGTKTIRVKADTNIPKVLDTANQSVYKMTGTFSNLEGTMKRTFTGVGSSVAEAEANMKSMANATGNLKQVSSKLQSSFKDANGKIVKTMTEANSATKKVTESTKKLSSALANVKSVAQGIVIAQTFYNAVNAIQDVVGSMWDMHKSVETNAMAFEQLTGSVELSKDMIEYLQKYAASTVFTFEQASQSAKTLLAYGFKLENLSYVMKTIGDATSAFGKPENFDRISLAMGQMLAKGTAKAEELRQLMEANVPVVEILSEKLGMTAEEVVNIGDHAVSSTKVVNALLEGLNERYGDMSSNMALTTTGLINNIRESVAYIGSQLFKPLYDGFSGILKPISEKLNELSTVIRNAGVDGAIKYLFPPDMYNSIKVFCGLLAQLGQAIFGVLKAIQPVGRELIYTFINTFNIAAPVIIMFLNILAKLISVLTANRAVLQAFISVFMGFVIVNTVTRMIRDFTIGLGVLANITTFATKAVALLRSAMLLLAANPVVAAITLISGALIALIMSSERGRAAVDRLWVSLARLMGIKNVEIYKPLDPGDLEDDLDNFFDKLDSNITGVEGGMEDVGDEAGNAGKKVKDKFVASFDELFQVPEQLDEVGNSMGGITDGLFDDLGSGGLDDLGKDLVDTGAFDIEPIEIPIIIPPPTMPTLPKPEPILVPILVTGLAAALQALRELGNALMNIPSKVSSWVDVQVGNAKQLLGEIKTLLSGIPSKVSSLIDIQAPNAIPLINNIANGINNVLLPGLTVIPEFFRGTVFPAFDELLQKLLSPLPGFDKMYQSIHSTMLPGFDALYQGITSMLPGFALIPQTMNGTVFPAFDEFVQRMRNQIITVVQSAPSEIAVMMSGLGAAISSGLTTAGTAAANVATAILKPFAELGANVLSSVAQGFASVIQFFVDLPSKIGQAVSPIKETITSKFSEGFTSVKESCGSFMDWMDGKWGWLAGALVLIVGGIAVSMTGGWAAVGAAIMSVVTPIISGITGAFSALMSGGLPGILAKGAAVCGTIFSVFTGGMSTAFADSKSDIENNADNMGTNVKSKFETMKSNVSTIFSNLKSDATQKWNKIKTTISNSIESARSTVSSKANSIKSNLSSTWNSVRSTASSTWSSVTSNISSNLSSILSKAQSIVSPFINAFNNIKNGVVNAVNSMFNTISSIFSRITSLISNITSSVSRAVSSVSNAVRGIFGRSISVDDVDLTPAPTSIPTPRSPLADVNIPQMYNGGVMTRDTLVGNARNSTMSAVKELGSIQQSLNNSTQSSPKSNNNSGSNGYTNMSNSVDDRPILYVGTLIADDRSLKELERKMEVIRTKERNRRV